MDENIGVISSMIVQTRPEQMIEIETILASFPGIEISTNTPSGKIVVLMEAESDRQLADSMTKIGDIPGVLGVNLVFHHSESAQ